MERIAEKAEVSRPALYRRYNDPGSVVLGALLAFGNNSLPMRYSDSLKDDLQAYYEAVVASLKRESAVGKALRGVLARALINDAFAEDFQNFIGSRREPVRLRIASARPKWTDRQIEAAVDALFGPMLYRILVRGVGVNELLIAALIDRATDPGI